MNRVFRAVLFLWVASGSLMSCRKETQSDPIGVASRTHESVVALPNQSRFEVLFEKVQQMIRDGDFPKPEDFLESFTGLYEENGVLHFQLGGDKLSSRQYRAEAMVKQIPGVDSFVNAEAAWWNDRKEAENAPLMTLFAGQFCQELYTEQMSGP